MSNHDDIDPARAATIDKRLAQAFAFARVMIAAPVMLEEIPDGSTLFFRDIVWQGQQLHLTAHPSKDRPGWWISRVTGPAQLAAESRQWVPQMEHGGMAGKWGSPPTYPEGGPTAEKALDALEEKLRDADHPDRMARRAVGG